MKTLFLTTCAFVFFVLGWSVDAAQKSVAPLVSRSRHARFSLDETKMMRSLESTFGEVETVIDSDDESERRLADYASLPANYTNTTSVVEHIGNTTIVTNTTVVKVTVNNSTRVIVLKSKEIFGQGLSTYCGSDADCADDEFCRKGFLFFMNKCIKCTPEDGECVSNEECCNDQPCVLGKCKDALYGSEGTLCDSSNDCNEGLCCALNFSFGRTVCKPLASEGEECQRRVSIFDLDYLFGVPSRSCPCSNGLQCRSTSGSFGFFGTPVCVSQKIETRWRK